MKKSLLTLTAVLAFGSLASFAQTEDKTVKFDGVASAWVRENNVTWTSKAQNDSKKICTERVENKVDEQIVGYYYFAGLLGFEFEIPEGMRVKNASITLITERRKGKKVSIRSFENNFSNNASWQDLNTYLIESLEKEPIMSFDPAGQSGMAIFDTGKSDFKDEFRNLAAWTNTIDVTDYIKTIKSSATRVNFLFTQDFDQVCQQNNFYSTQVTGENETGFSLGEETVTADDLKPYLTVVFEEDAATTNGIFAPSADTFVRSSAANNNYGAQGNMEIYWNGSSDQRDPEFYGLMSFTNLPKELASDEYELTDASLRLVTNQLNNGNHEMQVFEYPDVINQSEAKWTNTSATISQVLATEPILEFVAAGQNNKRMDDSGISDDYKTVDAWTNNIDLTDYLKSKQDPTSFSILLAKKTASDKGIRINTSESADIVNTKTDSANPFTFAADNLKPQLKLTYTKKGVASAVETIVVDNSDAPVEYYNLQGVKVANPEKGIYIVRQGTSVRKVIL